MGKPTGFIEFERSDFSYRSVEERITDYKEVFKEFPDDVVKTQAARCMDCGIPFCHQGCPLGNLIPNWNDMVYNQKWKEAIEELHLTNNFPEFTGTLCPAPCEGSCVLGINEPAVSIKAVEISIIDKAFKEGWVHPKPPKTESGKSVAVVGSGPAGLAVAQELRRAGHKVTVFERAPKIGGLLRYGIPDFKMEKHRLDRRLKQMEDEGVEFRTGITIGDDIHAEELKKQFDAIALCCGSTQPRDLEIEGRDFKGIHFAMEYLTQQNLINDGLEYQGERIHAKDKNVIIIGGGDTGADCLGTAHRHGAKSIKQIELLPRPPASRAEDNPWPQWPVIFRTYSAHAEGGDREYSLLTKRFIGNNGQLTGIEGVQIEWNKPQDGSRPSFKEVPGTEFTYDADLIFLAMGFVHPEKPGPINELKVEVDPRGNVKTNSEKMTSVDGVFAAGDMRRGQSLIVWAIAEGRECAKYIDEYLMGSSELRGSPGI